MSWMVLWMLTNTFFGIKLGLLFFEECITVWNILYYIGMLVSFVVIFRHIMAKWKKVPKFGIMENEPEN